MGGVRPPLFIVPEVGSDGRSCEGLARELGPEQPCLALQARSLINSSSQPADVAGTARLFANEILAITPKGPCAVAGLGFGSILAWETARLLAAAGCAVSQVALIGAPPKAFFEREGSVPTPHYRLIRPAGETAGLLGRFFRQASDGGVTKEMRQSRSRLGEASIGPAPSPVAIFTDAQADVDQPWRELAPAGIASFPSREAGARLADVLRQ
jgi:thioesterase domain-containing protein